jgi:hypothetical protein
MMSSSLLLLQDGARYRLHLILVLLMQNLPVLLAAGSTLSRHDFVTLAMTFCEPI